LAAKLSHATFRILHAARAGTTSKVWDSSVRS